MNFGIQNWWHSKLRNSGLKNGWILCSTTRITRSSCWTSHHKSVCIISNDEFCIENDELCIKNDECFINQVCIGTQPCGPASPPVRSWDTFPLKKDDFRLNNDDFRLNNDDLLSKNDNFRLKKDDFRLNNDDLLSKNGLTIRLISMISDANAGEILSHGIGWLPTVPAFEYSFETCTIMVLVRDFVLKTLGFVLKMSGLVLKMMDLALSGHQQALQVRGFVLKNDGLCTKTDGFCIQNEWFFIHNFVTLQRRGLTHGVAGIARASRAGKTWWILDFKMMNCVFKSEGLCIQNGWILQCTVRIRKGQGQVWVNYYKNHLL